MYNVWACVLHRQGMLDEWQLADLCETLAFLCPGDDTSPRVQQAKIETFLIETQQDDGNFILLQIVQPMKAQLVNFALPSCIVIG